jgi:DNA polymerase III delta prime subunit
MTYDFSSLAHADFEDLVRDLIGLELSMRFEAFGPGPDGGMDGRHSKGVSTTILQAKHYAGSTYSALAAAMKRERRAIDAMHPSRYVLATSRPLSPSNKSKLAKTIGPSLQSEADIYSAGDLNALLRKFPEIEKAHIKLWLSSAAVLERVTRAAAHAYAAITEAEIAAKVRVYAQNPSFKGSRDTLEGQHVLIISGPPGVGKTTLAEMLAYAYVGEGWELVPIRSLDDGFSAIVDAKKQIFYFDDFLGRVALDKNALASKDSDLARFMKRVRQSQNARFILTTRAYIFEEARRISEYFADQRLDISKYVLDVGVYTRRIRARILYNHLIVAETPPAHIRALIESGKIANIVDHANYNPRVIEWMTDSTRLAAVLHADYVDAFINALANPKQLWDTAFRTHIPEKCRHLLFALFFCSQYGEEIADLRIAYQSLHPYLCARFGHAHDPKDFEESLRILEGGFVSIRNGRVSFVNPSFRDYLTDYLDGLSLLREFALAAHQASWASQLWEHGKNLPSSEDELAEFARAFTQVGSEFLHIPTWRKSSQFPQSYRAGDLANADRIELLLKWWEASRDTAFAELSITLAENPVNGFSPLRDGHDLVQMIENIRFGYFEGFPFQERLLRALEDGVVSLLQSEMETDELETISGSIVNAVYEFSPDVVAAAKDAIKREFDSIERTAAEAEVRVDLGGPHCKPKKIGSSWGRGPGGTGISNKNRYSPHVGDFGRGRAG